MAVGNSTIQEFVDKGNDKNFSNYNFLVKEYFENAKDNVRLVISNRNLLDKYYYTLIQHTREIVLTDKELEQYRFKPQVFCLERYGTVELWNALLRFNNILTRAEFDRKKLRIFTMSFVDTLQEILIIEGDDIDKNREHVSL